jgi:hypothetical protein
MIWMTTKRNSLVVEALRTCYSSYYCIKQITRVTRIWFNLVVVCSSTKSAHLIHSTCVMDHVTPQRSESNLVYITLSCNIARDSDAVAPRATSSCVKLRLSIPLSDPRLWDCQGMSIQRAPIWFKLPRTMVTTSKAKDMPALRPSASLVVLNSTNEVLLVHRNPTTTSFSGMHVRPSSPFAMLITTLATVQSRLTLLLHHVGLSGRQLR